MVLTVLLLFLLFTAGLINIYFYVLSKKLYAWLPSLLFNRSPPPPTATKNTQDSHGAGKTAELKSVFATFDKNGDGFITRQELRESFKNIGIVLSEQEVEETMVKVDSNGDGLIDLEEFCTLYKVLMGGGEGSYNYEDGKEGSQDVAGDGEVDLKEAFDVFDVDKDGLISAEELGSVLSSLGLKEGKSFEDCKEMIRKIDRDGDGKVSFDEFKRMMKGGGTLVSAF